MDLTLLVYGISLLEGFKVFFGIGIVFSIIIFLISAVYTASWKLDGSEYSWNLNKEGKVKESIVASRLFGQKIAKYSFVAVVLFGLLNTFLPSERTAYMMVGAYATQKVSENEKVQQTGKKVLTLIEQKLDSYIDEGFNEIEKKAKPKKGKKDE